MQIINFNDDFHSFRATKDACEHVDIHNVCYTPVLMQAVSSVNLEIVDCFAIGVLTSTHRRMVVLSCFNRAIDNIANKCCVRKVFSQNVIYV